MRAQGGGERREELGSGGASGARKIKIRKKLNMGLYYYQKEAARREEGTGEGKRRARLLSAHALGDLARLRQTRIVLLSGINFFELLLLERCAEGHGDE